MVGVTVEVEVTYYSTANCCSAATVPMLDDNARQPIGFYGPTVPNRVSAEYLLYMLLLATRLMLPSSALSSPCHLIFGTRNFLCSSQPTVQALYLRMFNSKKNASRDRRGPHHRPGRVSGGQPATASMNRALTFRTSWIGQRIARDCSGAPRWRYP